MSYISDNLIKDEDIKLKSKIHWLIFLPSILIFLLSLTFVNSPEAYSFGLFFIFFSLFLFINSLIKMFTIEMAVTNKRVIAKKGFIFRNTLELNLSKVESLNIDQSILGRVFNYGTVIVRGTGGIISPFKFIKRPLGFRKEVNEQIEDNEKR